MADLQEVTLRLVSTVQSAGAEIFLSDATLYLENFGIIAMAWQWLRQAMAAQAALEKSPSPKETDFYTGKLFAFRYFYSYELPKIEGLSRRLRENDPLNTFFHHACIVISVSRNTCVPFVEMIQLPQ